MSLPRYAAYKDSGVEWLGQVPAHWCVRRLGFFFTERREKVSDKEFQPLSVTKNGVVPQLDTAAKTDDGDNRKLVRADDFVINSRSDRKGSSGASMLDGSVSLINTVLGPKSEISINFAHHLMRSIPFQEEYYRFGKGIVADLWSTNYSEMRNILLAIPELQEQQEIATFLDRETAKIDALIAEQEKLLALLAEKRQATISHAVTRGLDPNVPMKDSGIPWLGQVPRHWEVRRLRFVADIETGSADTADSLVDGDYPFFVRSQTVERINNFTHDCEAVLTAGDGAGVGKVFHHFVGKFCAHQRVYIFRNFHDISGSWFFEYMRALFYRVILGGTAKSTVDSLRRPMIADFPIVIPDPKEMPEIEQKIQIETSKLDHLVSEAENAICLLKERRSALIAAAVTGQIDVRGAVEGMAA